MNELTSRTCLEKRDLSVGFVPLTDCASLVAAHEKGFFEAEGLRVTLHRERSWASIRDKTAFGVFDAAQMLYPMPLASTLGVGSPAVAMQTGLCLSLGGNAVTVGQALHAELLEAVGGPELPEDESAAAVAAVIDRRRRDGRPALTFGCVFPTSTHHYELRQWLGSAGIDCDLDVRLLIVPPPDMPDALREGRIDGFCVGEPWNSIAVQRGWGHVVMTKHTLWNHGPEKVLGVTRDWAQRHPQTHAALLRSVIAAAKWCDHPDNREELVHMVAAPGYLDVSVEAVRPSLRGDFRRSQQGEADEGDGLILFHRYAAGFPWVSHQAWFIRRMIDAGQIDPPADADALAASVARPELYRDACAALGEPYPTIDHKPESVHAEPWQLRQASTPITMGPDLRLGEARPPGARSSGRRRV